jgi:hypothetical protein
MFGDFFQNSNFENFIYQMMHLASFFTKNWKKTKPDAPFGK